MSNELTVRPASQVAPVNEIDWNAAYKFLGVAPNDPKTVALSIVCNRYGFDPFLKHIVFIGSGDKRNMYVTRDGLLFVAHRSGLLDGITTEFQPETQTHFVAVASVYRKDMTRPFTFRGRYPKAGQMGGAYGPEMAEKVAMARALRFAFDVSLCSREELWDQDDDVPAVRQPSPKMDRQFVDEMPAPAAEPRPERDPLSLARKRFAKAIQDHGWAVDKDTVTWVLTSVWRFITSNDDPDIAMDDFATWDGAREALPNFVRWSDERKAADEEAARLAADIRASESSAGALVSATQPEPAGFDEFADFEDPFAADGPGKTNAIASGM